MAERKYPHTPGPWFYTYGQIYTVAGVPIGGADRNTPHTAPVERDANAQLMAAAPELLEALQQCITDAGATSRKSRDLLERRLQYISEIAQAAIIKATHDLPEQSQDVLDSIEAVIKERNQ